MKTRKGSTLTGLFVIVWVLVLLSLLVIPIFNSGHVSYAGFITTEAKLPLDCKEVISIQREIVECHVSYLTNDGSVKIRRYWILSSLWVQNIKWVKPEQEEL